MVKKCDHFEDLILCLSLYTNGIVFNRIKKTHCICIFSNLIPDIAPCLDKECVVCVNWTGRSAQTQQFLPQKREMEPQSLCVKIISTQRIYTNVVTTNGNNQFLAAMSSSQCKGVTLFKPSLVQCQLVRLKNFNYKQGYFTLVINSNFVRYEFG